MSKKIWGLVALTVVIALLASAFLAACNQIPTPTTQVEVFIPLAPPANAQYPAALVLQGVGDTETVTLMSSLAEIEFGEAGSSSAGGVKFEQFTHHGYDSRATLIEVNWGDWQNGEIRRAESFDPEGNLIEGRIILRITGASFLQFLSLEFRPTVDRSRLVFQYVAPEPGATPVLRQVMYLEEWGTNSNDILAMGQVAVWDQNVHRLFPDQSEWGFWETRESPFSQVTDALGSARDALKDQTPDLQIIDRDSVKEVIGRQTGLEIYRDGSKVGDIRLNYRNNFGGMPNTPSLGSGALSRIEWKFTDGRYYAMSVLSPALAPEPSSLYVFSTNEASTQLIEGDDAAAWPLLYEQIRNREIPGILFAVYSIGHIGTYSQTLSVRANDGTTNTQTFNTGKGGGLFYSVIGDPSAEEVTLANQLISLMGTGAIKATGLYYAHSQGSGNGLVYYLSILRVITANPENSLRHFGADVGILDRPGFPEYNELLGQ